MHSLIVIRFENYIYMLVDNLYIDIYVGTYCKAIKEGYMKKILEFKKKITNILIYVGTYCKAIKEGYMKKKI